MKKIEDMSYEEIINNSIPFKINIPIEYNNLLNMLDEKESFQILIQNFRAHMNKNLRSYLGNLEFSVKGYYMITDDGNRNVLKFSSEDMIVSLFYFLNCPEERELMKQYSMNNELGKQIDLLRNCFIKKRKQLENATCVEDLKDISERLYQCYLRDIDYYSDSKNFEKQKSSDVLEFKKTSMWMKELFKKLEQPMDCNMLYPINKVKLMLFLAKQYFEVAKVVVLENSFDYYALLLMKYVDSFLNRADVSDKVMMRMLYYYSPKLSKEWLDLDDDVRLSVKNYSVRKLREEVSTFLEQHLDFKKNFELFSKYDKDDFCNLSIREIVEYMDLIFEEVQDNWKVIEEKEIVGEVQTLIDRTKNANAEERNNMLLISKKISILLKHEPIKVIQGIDTFQGYYGFFYPNGNIVLETLYEDEEKKKIASGQASYSMGLDKFRDYAKLKKQELMKKEDVERLIHRGNWEERFVQMITREGKNPNNTFLELLGANIDSIVNLNELSRCLEQLKQLEESVSKDKIVKEVKKIERRKKRLVLKKLEEESNNYPSNDFLSRQEEQELQNTESEILTTIDSNNFVDFLSKYYQLLEENMEFKKRREQLKRNPAIAVYTKQRAHYTCDLCENTYLDESFFDSHHLIPLKDGGPDQIYNTVCLCPNCHRIAHTTGFRDNEMYLLMKKIFCYLEKEELSKEYKNEFYKTFWYYLQVYMEEDWFMEWNQHKISFKR